MRILDKNSQYIMNADNKNYSNSIQYEITQYVFIIILFLILIIIPGENAMSALMMFSFIAAIVYLFASYFLFKNSNKFLLGKIFAILTGILLALAIVASPFALIGAARWDKIEVMVPSILILILFIISVIFFNKEKEEVKKEFFKHESIRTFLACLYFLPINLLPHGLMIKLTNGANSIEYYSYLENEAIRKAEKFEEENNFDKALQKSMEAIRFCKLCKDT